jgi:hypothetical protein
VSGICGWVGEAATATLDAMLAAIDVRAIHGTPKGGIASPGSRRST